MSMATHTHTDGSISEGARCAIPYCSLEQAMQEARHFRIAMDAFKRLAIQETCPKHVWSTPRRARTRDVFGRRSTELFETQCTLCGRRASRATLKRLKAEIIDA